MLRMPTSTADSVTIAPAPLTGLPPASRSLIFTGTFCSGTALAGAVIASCSLRASRDSGRWTRPSARDGVTRSPWLPARKATTPM